MKALLNLLLNFKIQIYLVLGATEQIASWIPSVPELSDTKFQSQETCIWPGKVKISEAHFTHSDDWILTCPHFV